MAQEAALINHSFTNRVRVRTPGKYIVLFLFAPVALVAIGAGLWLNYVNEQSRLASLEYRTAQNGAETAYYALPEMLVDLSPDRDGRTAYLKLRASIVLSEDETRKTARNIAAAQPLVTERLTFFLRILRPEDFQGAAALEQLKAEMAKRINLVIAPDEVDGVIIEDLVIQ